MNLVWLGAPAPAYWPETRDNQPSLLLLSSPHFLWKLSPAFLLLSKEGQHVTWLSLEQPPPQAER